MASRRASGPWARIAACGTRRGCGDSVLPVFGRRATCAAGASCTTQRRNTSNSELRQVQYAWHPLHGQHVIVCLEQVRRSVPVAHCRLPGREDRSSLEIPQWMFDRATCAAMRWEQEPRVSWQTLADLKNLLGARTAQRQDAVVQSVHHLSEGDAHAPPAPPATEGRTEPVQARTSDSRLAGLAGGDSPTDPAIARPGASSESGGGRHPRSTDGGGR
ncbi:MAG: hypothetical protein BWX88_04656 [Planctomycetes bacterium ADurb.Bin126]|nr:MAG: hypothetical protein BWX88_04656 [Planctomycetes bacterium ADurb.Bin126]